MQFQTIEDYAVFKIRERAALLDPIIRRDLRREQLRCLPTTFPNALGNYRGKRKAKPLIAPLAGRERFVRLVAAFEAFKCHS